MPVRAGAGNVRGVLVMGLAAIWALAAACAVLGGALLGPAVCWLRQDRADRDFYARAAGRLRLPGLTPSGPVPRLCLVTGWPLLKRPHVAVGVIEI